MELKKDWEIKKLGEVCQIKGGKRIPKGKKLLTEKTLHPYIRVTDFTDDGTVSLSDIHYISDEIYETIKQYTITTSDVFISIAGTIGKVGIIPVELNNANLTENACKLILNDRLYNKYLVYVFQSDKIKAITQDNARANAMPKLSLTRLSNIEIPVPPLEEQKRIVKILDEKFAQLESLKANAQTNLQNAKDLFQSQLAKAFSNTTWEKKRLGDCGTFKNGMNFAATDSGYTIRSLGVGDFKDRYSIDTTETLSEISLKAAPSEDYLLHDGDIVFVRSNGNKELVGRCLLVYPKDIPTTYSGFCIRFRKDFDLLDADFLLHFMKAESSRKILNGKEGANISNLNQKILGDFEVPLPPLPEQKRIVKELDTLSEKVRQLQEIYTKQIANCDELKQSYLQKTFEGEL